MLKKIKRLFNMNIVEWVDNSEKEYNHLEADKYLLVESKTEGKMLFTKSQIKRAKQRVPKQTEEI